jgi:hypothetical protein
MSKRELVKLRKLVEDIHATHDRAQRWYEIVADELQSLRAELSTSLAELEKLRPLLDQADEEE